MLQPPLPLYTCGRIGVLEAARMLCHFRLELLSLATQRPCIGALAILERFLALAMGSYMKHSCTYPCLRLHRGRVGRFGSRKAVNLGCVPE